MDNPTIIFRADGNTEIGMGHFIRSLALAEMIRDHFYCIYATRNPSAYQINEIQKVCFQRIDLPDDNSHFELFLSKLTGNEVVVLDNYYFTTSYQQAIKAKGCKLVCIDDLHDKKFYADLIINPDPGVTTEDYQAQKYTQFALGSAYTLVRQAFWEKRTRKRTISHIETLFVCFGGADPFNITEITVQIVREILQPKRMIVVTGDAYHHKNRLKNSTMPFCEVEIYQAVDDHFLARLMAESDLAVIPASGILFEAMITGLPAITGYYVMNQEATARYFDASRLALSCGNMQLNYRENLTEKLKSLNIKDINDMVLRQKSFFSHSKENFLKRFRQLSDR